MSNYDARTEFAAIFRRMEAIGWILPHVDGPYVDWTERGTEIASCLYSIIDEFELVDDDMFVREFDLAAHGIASDGNVGSEIEISERDAVTWRMVVSELGLWDGNNNGLFALVHIVDGWAPYG